MATSDEPMHVDAIQNNEHLPYVHEEEVARLQTGAPGARSRHDSQQ